MFSYSLEYVRQDNSVGATIGHADTYEQLASRLEADRIYYLTLGYSLRPAIQAAANAWDYSEDE